MGNKIWPGPKTIKLSSLKKIIDNEPGPGPPPDNQLRSACVFLLLYNKEDPHCLAIQKSDTDGYPWRNQVALPGGHIDKTDASPLEAAYRELKEEVNIPPNQVELIGSLGHFQTLLKPRDIEVFVGWWTGEGPVSFDPVEISRVLEIPLNALIETHMNNGYHGRQFSVKELTYPFLDVVIWGASARIFHHFIERIFPMLDDDGYLADLMN
ncbi:MAG: CoA pyrophosphatase [Deltaproteobacteria bacterium]|jgi:8-oxo-dGTP pyrophosphatase MutT (NUDIX family)|nr:CoA pyrophosphatase [Deltaproteobacteria bacterium]